MATAEDSARYILAIMKERGVNAGEIAMTGWFVLPFNEGDWRGEDFTEGLNYAKEQGWVTENGAVLKLTTKGAAEYA